ncbi:hypothetical protein KAU43_05830 [candidate division WOR-3 bacterium]|nr:hypothetical protein [candidate division WOR-3 bacterium]
MGWKGESRRHSLSRKGIKTNIDKTKRLSVRNFVAKGRTDNQFYINDLIIEHREIIAESLRRTRATDNEHGFSICRDDDGNHYASRFSNTGEDGICEGEECYVQMPHCMTQDGSDYAMEFHTHPDGTISGYFSGQDVREALMKKPDFLCLGVNYLDSYMINKFPESASVIRDKNRATITCWQLIKDKDDKIIAWDEVDEFDKYWLDRRDEFHDWFHKYLVRVRKGESNLFKQTEFTINLETEKTELKENK